MRKRLYILVGAPGGGKTTYVKNYADRGHSAHISRDAIRFSLLADGESYFKKEKEVYKTFISQIKQALDSPWVTEVWADATHIDEASRHKLLSHLDGYSFDAICVVRHPSLETCLSQNALREGRARVPDASLTAIYNKYEDPLNDTIPYEGVFYSS